MPNRSFSPDEFDQTWAECELLRPPAFASLPEKSLLRSIGSNLLGCLARLPQPPVDRAYAPMFRSAYLRGRAPGRSLLASALLHIGAIACLVNLPSLPNPARDSSRATAPQGDHKIVWYYKADLLPAVSPPVQTPHASQPKRRKGDAVSAENRRPTPVPVQVIISRPPKPNNDRQTIIQPELPDLRIASQVAVPNLVQWSGAAVPPRPAVSDVTKQLAQIHLPHLTAPSVAPPPPRIPEPPELRPSSRLEPPHILRPNHVPVPPPPAVSEASRQLAQINVPHLPVPTVAAPPPAPPGLPQPNRNISQVPWQPPSVASPPRPSLPEQPPSLNAAINPQGGSGALRNLIAVGVAPSPPPEEISVPQGNRPGEFEVKPGNSTTNGKSSGGETGKSSNRPGMQELADRDLGGIRVPNLWIAPPSAGASPAEAGGRVVARPPESRPTAPAPPARDENMAKLIAKATRPSIAPEMSRGRQPDAFFGMKRIYTVSINMPNLTSGSGSWVLRFAEPNGSAAGNGDLEISSPVAVRKVDPSYIPSAIRERLEGTVTLAAYILRDGTVSNIRVLRSLDARLDSSAAAALSDWQFVPARKNGVAIDLEVVVQIPFRLPSF